jgi:hypothetical protein
MSLDEYAALCNIQRRLYSSFFCLVKSYTGLRFISFLS